MSQFNLKLISALIILGLGITEILVFNEEVFIFVCFFIFFNLISISAGSSISQIFQDIGNDLEKNFLQTSKEAKTAIASLVLSKEQALHSIVRVLIFLKAFRNIAVQKGMLLASESFVQNTQSCASALNAFQTRSSSDIHYLSNSVAQAFIINSKSALTSLHSKSGSPFSVVKGFSVSSKPKQKARLVDRLLGHGFLSASKSTLS
uniref:ATP synthase F0 subunit b n=1 Tax=Diacronema viridis TaxID=2793420 RepID=A0A7T1W6K1_9EUKA|nr:ATP synthase F0 subunit b [Diacronema viridis]QPO84601.1 ATP synthase F0 subunit b [Diacronema viridis]QPO84621.1 ATP synthase F0 subunit b [Diacronema viridis]